MEPTRMYLKQLWTHQKKRYNMDTRKDKFPHGIPGHNLSEIEREIPIEEPPAWPINKSCKRKIDDTQTCHFTSNNLTAFSLYH